MTQRKLRNFSFILNKMNSERILDKNSLYYLSKDKMNYI